MLIEENTDVYKRQHRHTLAHNVLFHAAVTIESSRQRSRVACEVFVVVVVAFFSADSIKNTCNRKEKKTVVNTDFNYQV